MKDDGSHIQEQSFGMLEGCCSTVKCVRAQGELKQSNLCRDNILPFIEMVFCFNKQNMFFKKLCRRYIFEKDVEGTVRRLS